MKTKNLLYVFSALLLFMLSAKVSGQNMNFRLYEGQIINPVNNSPVPDIVIFSSKTQASVMSNTEGRFSIITPLGSILNIDTVIPGFVPIIVTEKNSVPFNSNINNIINDQSSSPYFEIVSESEKAWLPLQSTIVDVNIAGIIASVSVKQIYVNKGEDVLEAVYVFPGSVRAAVFSMKMTIGDRVVNAVIKEKEEARQEYEDAKSSGKTASLLEQSRPNVFQMNVANILPGDSVIVEMSYVEEIYSEYGVYSFVFPTVVGPRYSTSSEAWVKNSKLQNSEKPQSKLIINTKIFSATPINFVKSSSHSIDVNYPSQFEAEVNINPNDKKLDVISPETISENYWIGRDYIIRYGLRGKMPKSGILTYEHNDENFFLLNIQAPEKISRTELPKREYIFIIDVSGSMNGFPISISKQLMLNLLNNLNPEDKFNVMLFSGGNNFLSKESMPATQENIKNAMKIIDKERGIGYTEVLGALNNALAYSPGENYARTFVIITDGYVTVEKEAFKLINDNIGNANMFAFGIGSSVNRYIIDCMAYAGNGEPFYITNQTEADIYGKKFLELIRNPVLTDIKIDYGDFDVYDLNINKIPDLFSEKPVIIFGKYKGNVNGKITITGTRGENNPYSETVKIQRNNTQSTAALRYLWARNKIRYLDDFAANIDGLQDKKSLITELGLKYNLLTNYTSFVAVDNTVRIPVQEKDNSHNNNEPDINNFLLNMPTGSEVEEVIVTAIGISRHNKAISYSTVNVSSDENVQVLNGKVSGVSIINSSGTPGANSKITIRGSGTVIQGEPLYIIDGVPANNNNADIGNSSNMINPETIESIRFLKGYEATALYGNRASNGVIIISTKQAENTYNKFNIKLNSSFALNKADLLPDLQSDFAQGREISGIPVWQSAQDFESLSWGPAIADLEYDNSGNLVAKNTGNGNPAKAFDKFDFLQTGYTNANNLSLSYNGELQQLNIMFGNYSEKGFLPNSSVKNNSLKINSKTKFSEKFSNLISAGASIKEMKNLSLDHSYSDIYRNMLISSPSFNDSSFISFDGGNTDNPYFSAERNSLNHEFSNYSLLMSPKFITGNFNFSASIFDKISFRDSKSTFALNSAKNPDGEMNILSNKTNDFFSNLNINFDSNIDRFNIDAELEGFYSKNTYRQTENFSAVFFSDNFIAENALINTSDTKNFDKKTYGSKAKVTVDFLTSIFLTLNGELINSNIPKQKSLFSKSVNVSFILSDYLYTNFITYLKIYASVFDGKTDLPMYWDEKMYAGNEFSIYNHLLPVKEISNSLNIDAEKSTNYSFGTNIKLFRLRIELDAEYYIQNTQNYYAPVNPSSNSVEIINAGTMKKSGFDIILNANMIKRKNLNVKTSIGLYKYTSSMSEISNSYPTGIELASMPGFSLRLANDLPAGALFGTKYLRNQEGKIVTDSQGIPVVSSEQSYLGSREPDFIASINSDIIIFRKINFQFNIDARKGGKIWNGTQNALNYYGVSQQSADFRLENPNAYEIMTANGEFGVAEDAVCDASMLRLNYLSIGYSFNNQFLRKIKIKEININIFAQNLFTFSKTKGITPDSFLTGNTLSDAINYFNTPGIKTAGIKLSFEI